MPMNRSTLLQKAEQLEPGNCAHDVDRVNVLSRYLPYFNSWKRSWFHFVPPYDKNEVKLGRSWPTRQESSVFTYPVAAGIVLPQSSETFADGCFC